MWVYLEARRRPVWHLALAVPLGAAILTKSVLGLMPLLALVGCLASEELRAPLRRPWVWIGVALGLAVGASWPLHQWWTQGPDAVASHFLAHVVRRSTRSFRLSVLREYPTILLKFFQPVVLPGLVGLWLVLRRPGPLRAAGRRPRRLDRAPAGPLQPVGLPDAAVRLPHPARRWRSCAGHALVDARAAPGRAPRLRARPGRRGGRRPRLLVEPVAPHARRERRLQAERGDRSRRWRPPASRCRTSATTTGRRRAPPLLRGAPPRRLEPVGRRRRRGGAPPRRPAPSS